MYPALLRIPSSLIGLLMTGYTRSTLSYTSSCGRVSGSVAFRQQRAFIGRACCARGRLDRYLPTSRGTQVGAPRFLFREIVFISHRDSFILPSTRCAEKNRLSSCLHRHMSHNNRKAIIRPFAVTTRLVLLHSLLLVRIHSHNGVIIHTSCQFETDDHILRNLFWKEPSMSHMDVSTWT